MKKIISLLSIVILSLCSSQMKGQITPYLEQITVNGSSISDCSTIAFGTNSSVNLSLKLRVTKSTTNDVGNFATFKLYILKNGSSSPQFINGILINNSAFWNNGTLWEGVFSQTLQASDIDVSGSIFYGVYEVSSDIHPNTCNYSLTKTPPPSFSFTPTSLSLPCGDTSSRTFTVTPANIPSGASVTYQWSYSGWSQISSTSTSKTLQPSSSSSLPSNVSVTPFINGVAQTTQTCTITRSAFTSSASITGSNSICTPATTGSYSISGLLAGQSVTWSSSNTAIATVSSTTGNTITVNRVSNGTFNLIAKITNQCGQFVNVQRSIRFGGAPLFTVQQNTGVASNIELLTLKGINNANIANEQITNVVWEEVQLNNADCGDVFGSGGVNAYVDYYVNNCNMQVKVTATNSCGSTIVYKTVQNNRVSGGPEARLSQKKYSVFPNPAKDIVTIELIDQENQTEKNTTISGELFDMMGQSKSKVQILDNKATFSVRELKKGIYILKIYINDQVEIHQIAVE